MSHQAAQANKQQQNEYQDCFACKVIGTAALGAVGVYALNQSRSHQPGSVFGKRVMAGIGLCFLAASYGRWNTTMFRSHS